ncbi:hypothetical protein ELQ92_15875 [Labedella populi]|uniref:DUF3558 domain-containing protein n=1 Tax=Labedella populi TaxID=2498850 RepID=A0A444Q1H0_9MICO|nr:hypothetical protein [Labedella populi]RWZ55098.1 hypothetical protein ELQ92_15875 [Labedella populi]
MRSAPVVIVIAVVMSLAGCSYGSPVPDTSVSVGCSSSPVCEESLDVDEMLAQWETSVAALDRPAGTSMVRPDPSDLGGGDQAFDLHYGESIAYSQWFCLWEGEWLAQADPSSPEAQAAMVRLRSFFETPTFREDYGGDIGLVTMVEDAAEGDPERLQRDFELNCSEPVMGEQ